MIWQCVFLISFIIELWKRVVNNSHIAWAVKQQQSWAPENLPSMQGVLFSGINTKFMPRYIKSLVPILLQNLKSFRKWIHREGWLWSCRFCLKYLLEKWGPAADCGSSNKFWCNQILIYCNQSKEGSVLGKAQS